MCESNDPICRIRYRSKVSSHDLRDIHNHTVPACHKILKMSVRWDTSIILVVLFVRVHVTRVYYWCDKWAALTVSNVNGWSVGCGRGKPVVMITDDTFSRDRFWVHGTMTFSGRYWHMFTILDLMLQQSHDVVASLLAIGDWAFIWKPLVEWLSMTSDLAQLVKANCTNVTENTAIWIIQMSSINWWSILLFPYKRNGWWQTTRSTALCLEVAWKHLSAVPKALAIVFQWEITCCLPDNKVHGDGAHLGPVGPRWVPCWPHEPCY